MANTRAETRIPMGRQVIIDRGRYTGDDLRELQRKNGSGRSLRQTAIRDARKALGIKKPGWMLDAEAKIAEKGEES
jgi:hypothetical protein